MNRVLMRSALVVPMLAACSQGSPGDFLAKSPVNPVVDGGMPADLNGTITTTTQMPVDFTNNTGPTGLACGALASTAPSVGSLTLDGTSINLGVVVSAEIHCLVKSAPVTLPANAKRLLLKFKTSHNFNFDCSSGCVKPRITWGTIQLQDNASAKPNDLQPSFHEIVPSGNAYDVAIEFPPPAKQQVVAVGVVMNGFVNNWSTGEKFQNFAWTFNGMTFEITK